MLLFFVWIAAVYVASAVLIVQHELALRAAERSVGLRVPKGGSRG